MGILDGKMRLYQEVQAMRERVGERAVLRLRRTRVWWELDIRMEGNVLPIKIEYPDCYPALPPELITRVELPTGTPHCLPGKRLCWGHDEPGKPRTHWDPARDTAALFVGVAERFFLAFLIWRATQEWPEYAPQ